MCTLLTQWMHKIVFQCYKAWKFDFELGITNLFYLLWNLAAEIRCHLCNSILPYICLTRSMPALAFV